MTLITQQGTCRDEIVCFTDGTEQVKIKIIQENLENKARYDRLQRIYIIWTRQQIVGERKNRQRRVTKHYN